MTRTRFFPLASIFDPSMNPGGAPFGGSPLFSFTGVLGGGQSAEMPLPLVELLPIVASSSLDGLGDISVSILESGGGEGVVTDSETSAEDSLFFFAGEGAASEAGRSSAAYLF